MRNVLSACGDLAELPGTAVIARSRLYRSAPVEAGGPDFINAVVKLTTILTAPALLSRLQQLENAAGRTRPFWHAPRTLDLDLLLFGDGSIQSALLTVPHPRMHERAFALLPLADVAPDRVPASLLRQVAPQRCVVLDEATPATSQAAMGRQPGTGRVSF